MAYFLKSLMRQTTFTLLIVLSVTLNANAQNGLTSAFAESYTHENSGDFAKAIESLKKVYNVDSYETNLRLGWLYYQQKKYKESQEYYQKAIILMPLSIEAKLGIAYPLYALGYKEALVNNYKHILEIDPSHYFANYRLGLVYYEQQDFSNASKHFQKTLNFYPFDYDALIMSAWTYYRLGNLREAKVLFNKALLNRPGDTSAQEGLKLIK